MRVGDFPALLDGCDFPELGDAHNAVGIGSDAGFPDATSQNFEGYLTSRPDGLLRAFDSLPRRSIGLEETRTYKKTKFVTEDAGVCLLDAEQRRLLIEGCQYRCVIHAKDVTLVEPVSGYALSGARLLCRFGEQNLDFVLTTAGQGPLASLLHTFAPSEGASSLAGVINQTLFAIDTTHYRQAAPPPIPTSSH